ncbi:hypothetical protein [Spiroplasma endosymbiont of Melieria omissa]
MPKPYSEDLRRKVIEAYESKNMKIKEIFIDFDKSKSKAINDEQKILEPV